MGLGGVAGLSVAAWQTMFPWLKYDLQYLKIAKKAGEKIAHDVANQRYVIDMFEESAAKYPNKPMIIFEDREYTYEFMNEQAKKVANIAYDWKFKTGETVAMFLQNSPAFVWTFLGKFYIILECYLLCVYQLLLYYNAIILRLPNIK